MNAGGKGANQAVAAKRLGADVIFICKKGNDIFGEQALKGFNEEGINTAYIVTDPSNPSGIALITVDENAENCIVVASGANANLMPMDLSDAKETICSAAIVLMQLEIPIQTVNFAAALARQNGIKVILNPAPACQLTENLLQNIWMITPNENEAEILAGIPVTDEATVEAAATIIRNKGVENVIITLGSKGAFVLTKDIRKFVAAPEVKAIDTTAAGDVFNGALAVALLEDMPLIEAVSFACHAAAISVTRMGAQCSSPYRKHLMLFMEPRS